VPDKHQPVELVAAVAALIALRAACLLEQADLLVIANGGDFHAGAPRHLSDR
jgi:hypothetical protein